MDYKYTRKLILIFGLTLAMVFSTASVFAATRVYSTSSQSIPNYTWTPLIFQNVDFSTSNSDVSFNSPSQIVCKTPGTYVVTGGVSLPPASGRSIIAIVVNGNTYYNQNSIWNTTLQTTFSVSDVINLNSGDYVEILVNQYSGSTISTYAGNNTISVARITQ